ncbi:MAG: hypothetical protein II142_07895 [Bacteroidales bacterium]|nr:hypothetical protein [Bacteroidales bacterium]MBQ3917198.1 hypothetical protein [Bacteroidales bacterium]
MKKIVITSILAFAALGAGAQTAYDAMTFSENNYSGTARTIAMGNAFTALGGDLGSYGINPAGSAVNRYSQISFTPNLSSLSSSSEYFANPMDNAARGTTSHTDMTRFYLSNVGGSTYIDLRQRYGLKGISFGFVVNMTNNMAEKYVGRGLNDYTSYLGQLASGLNGYASSNLDKENAFNNPDIAWREIVAWKSGMISNLNNNQEDYIGATEKVTDSNGNIGLGGTLDQAFRRRTHGSKRDLLFNMGFNVSDMFYFGGNIGITSFSMKYDEYTHEIACNPDDFPNEFSTGTTNFDRMMIRNSYSADGTGIYGKFGAIFVPIKELRFGMAIQTPTLVNINETWQTYGEIDYTDSRYDGWKKSPLGEYEYELVSPFRFNAGMAFNFGIGVVSADYEIVDYKTMRFRNRDGYSSTSFDGPNQDIKDLMTISNSLRVGMEIKPVPSFAIRAGYSFATSPEKELENNFKALYQTASFGLGYSSNGSFFWDAAIRGSFKPNLYTTLYEDYIEDRDIASPQIRTKTNIVDFVMTFGWRF